MFGDFAQLPPVKDTPLYSTKQGKALRTEGQVLYSSITKSITLDVVHRQAGDEPEQVAFQNALMNLRTYSITDEDYDLLSSHFWTRLTEAERATFSLETHLLPTKAAVQEFNTLHLASLDKPVLKCMAKHKGPGSKDVSEEDAEGLSKVVFLAEGAKVMLSHNLWTIKGNYCTAQI